MPSFVLLDQNTTLTWSSSLPHLGEQSLRKALGLQVWLMDSIQVGRRIENLLAPVKARDQLH